MVLAAAQMRSPYALGRQAQRLGTHINLFFSRVGNWTTPFLYANPLSTGILEGSCRCVNEASLCLETPGSKTGSPVGVAGVLPLLCANPLSIFVPAGLLHQVGPAASEPGGRGTAAERAIPQLRGHRHR